MALGNLSDRTQRRDGRSAEPLERRLQPSPASQAAVQEAGGLAATEHSLRTVIVISFLLLGGVLLLRWLGRVAPVLLLGAGGLAAGGQMSGILGFGVWPGFGDVLATGATVLASCLLAFGAMRGAQRLEEWPGGTRWTSRPSSGPS